MTGVLKEGLKLVVGSGNTVSFWKDVWNDNIPLKIAFPRIFALAENIGGKIEEFGS